MSSSILSSEYVTDTMALVLHLESRRSSQIVRQIFEAADSGDATLHIPTIVFAEILYLSEKGRISLTLSYLKNHLAAHQSYIQLPLSFEIVHNASSISDIPELHDRLIASSANFADLELITNDPKIQNSTFVKTIW